MKTVEQIKESILKHEAVLAYLQSQRMPFVKNLKIEHEYREELSYNVVEIFKDLTPTELGQEEMLLRDEIVQRIEILNAAIEKKITTSCLHNRDLDNKINKLKQAFKEELSDVSEIALSSRMDITMKNIEKVDREHFINAYLALGITHYNFTNDKHSLYYNPEKFHFNTLKEDIFKSVPLAIQKKYPSFVAKIQNQKLNTRPESNTQLFEVVYSRK